MQSQISNRCAFLITFAALIIAMPAHAIIISSSFNKATSGLGYEQNVDYWKGVGMVGRLDADNNRRYFCTGTLIQPPANAPQTKKWVLTAAHCAFDNNFDMSLPANGGDDVPNDPDYSGNQLPDDYPAPPRTPPSPNPQDPYFGKFDDNKMLFRLPKEIANQHYVSKKIYIHPNYATDRSYDVAVIELNAEVPSVAWQINTGQIADERNPPANPDGSFYPGQLVGYGAGGSKFLGETLVYGTKRRGVNWVDAFGGANNQKLLFDFDDHLGGNGPLGGPAVGICPNIPGQMANVVNCEANTTHGDSGGPMFMADVANNAWRVVGVTSGGDGMGFGKGGVGLWETGYDVRVQSVAGWVNSVTMPEPTTASFLLTGLMVAIGSRARRRTA